MAEDVTLRFRTKGVGRAVAAFDKLEQNADQLRQTAEKFRRVGAGLTAGLTLPLAAAGAAAVKLASDAQETQNLFNTAMGSMREEANAFVQQWSEATDLDPVATQERLANFQLMISRMGIASDRALEMSKNLTTLTVDLASLQNVSFERAFTKLQSGLSGEMEALRRWGIIVGQAKIEQVALREGIVEAGEEMSQQEKIIARYMAIMEQTDKTQGDFIDTQDDFANQLRTLQDQVEKVARQFGETLLPTASDILSHLKDALGVFELLTPEMRKWITIMAAASAAAGPFLVIMTQLVIAITDIITLVKGAGGLSVVLGGLATGPIAAVVAALVGGGALIWAFDQLKEVHRGVTKTSKSLREETKKLADELKGMGEEAIRSARMLTAASLADVTMQISDLQQQRREAFTEEVPVGSGGRLGLGVQQPDTDFQKRIAQLREMQSALQDRLRVLGERTFGGEGGGGVAGAANAAADAMASIWEGAIDAQKVFQNQLERTRRALVDLVRLENVFGTPILEGPTTAQQVRALLGRTEPAAARTPLAVRAQGLPAKEMVNAAEFAGASMQELVNVTLQGGKGLKRAAQATISAFGAMAQAAIRGSDQMATSLIQGITQIVRSIPGVGGLAGSIIGTAGSLLSAAFSGGSDQVRPQPVTVENDDPIDVEDQSDRGPEEVVLQFLNAADPEQLQHDLNRRTKRDGVTRIPFGTDITGG